MKYIPTVNYGLIAVTHSADAHDQRESFAAHADLYLVGAFPRRITYKLVATLRRLKSDNDGDWQETIRRNMERLVRGWRGELSPLGSRNVRTNIYVVQEPHLTGATIEVRLRGVDIALWEKTAARIVPSPLGPTLSGDLRPCRVERIFKNTSRRVDVFGYTVSRRDAQAYCSDPETSSSHCAFDEALNRTRTSGDWMDTISAA